MVQNGLELDNEINLFIEESCSDYYYFEKFIMFLYEKEVSKIILKFCCVFCN